MMTRTQFAIAVSALSFALATESRAQASAEPASPRPTAVQPAAPAVTGSGPNGATLRCRDGSYPATGAPDSACESRGGVLVRFPMRRVPEAAAVPAERAVPVPTQRTLQRDTTPPAGFVPFDERQAQLKAEADRAAVVPANATLLCNDGSYIQSDTSAARCASRGGLKLRINALPPTAARQRPRGN